MGTLARVGLIDYVLEKLYSLITLKPSQKGKYLSKSISEFLVQRINAFYFTSNSVSKNCGSNLTNIFFS